MPYPSASCRFILAAAVIAAGCSTLAAQPTAPPAVDWERALAAHNQIDQTIKDRQRWQMRSKPTSEQVRDYNHWILARHPGTALAADIEARAVAGLLTHGQYDKVAPAAMAMVDKYPIFTDKHDIALISAQRVIRNADLADEVRLSAFETLIPGFKDRALLLSRACSALRKIEAPAAKKYELVRRAGEACGRYPQVAECVWEFLRQASRELGEERYIEECRALVSAYGQDTLAGRAAAKVVLNADAAAGDASAAEALEQLTAEESAAMPIIEAAFDAARRALDAGDVDAACEALRRASMAGPACLAEPAWLSLLRGSTMTSGEASQVIPALAVLLEHGPDGDAIDHAYTVLNRFRYDAAALPLFIQLAQRHVYDRQRSCDIASVALRLTQGNTPDAQVELAAARAGAQTAGRLNAHDRQVSFLLRLGKLAWHTPEGREALRVAASYYPAIHEAAEAGWLLALIDGHLSVEQDPLPRQRVAEDETATAPDVELPTAPAPRPSLVAADGVMTLAPRDPAVDLLAGSVTAWEPESLPASRILPLDAPSTVDRVRVVADKSLYFTVSLLDRDGRTLARVERDWGLWEHYRSTAYWPDASQDLKLLPTPGVCFVRLDVYDTADQHVRVQSVQAFAPPVEVEGVHLNEPIDLDNTARSVRVDWQADEPSQTVSYDASGEWARGYMTLRWSRFWTRTPRPLALRSAGGSLGVSFHGTNATLVLDKPGAVLWRIDDGETSLLPHPDEDKSEHKLDVDLTPGLHVLRVSRTSLPPTGDNTAGAADTRFVRLDVEGVSRVRVAVRFADKSGKWGPWSAPLSQSGVAIAVPSEINGGKPVRAQAGAFFDAREVRAQSSAALHRLELTASDDPGEPATTLHHLPLLREDVPAVAELLERRELVVVYPKAGTQAEYDAARRLAEKAAVYLVSDDIGLNNYKGRVLAVGTPLRHRYARQLLATHGVWNTLAFFAHDDGLVAKVGHDSAERFVAAVTGDTPEAVVRAAERLLKALPDRTTPTAAVRLLASNSLEDVYPWQLAGDRPALEQIELRVAQNDRRSAQFVAAADRAVTRLNVTVDAPVSESGQKLPAPLVRPVGFYEWVPFFGDLRLPNLLLERSAVSMPANTARGVWLTVLTPADAKPGLYKAQVTVDADGQITRLPLLVRVEPVPLAKQTRAATYSFAGVPYWYMPGTPEWESALRALAANEAAHGATHVGVRMSFTWTTEPQTAPSRMTTAPADTAPGDQTWHRYSASPKSIEAGQALLLAYDAPIQARELYAAVEAPEGTSITLSHWDGRSWVELDAQPLRGSDMPSVLRWKPGTAVEHVRLTANNDAAFTVHRVGAFTNSDREHPFTVDFSAMDRQMDIFEEAYAKLGLVPRFIIQTRAELNVLANDVFGVGHYHFGAIGFDFGAQLRAHLERSGRLERMMIKVGDEPGDIAAWAAAARDFHDAGLRTMTCHSGNYPNIDVAAGVMDPWCPNYVHNVLRPFFRERQAAGDEVWWYICGTPTTRLTGTPIESLPFYWLTAKWNFDGAMNYAAMHPNDYSMPVPFRYEHGMDHRIVYLPDGTLLDTPRRELETEGIQDLKLIEFVRGRVAAAGDAAAADAIRSELDQLLAETVSWRFGYSQEPADWLAARDRLYDLAVRVADLQR